MSYIRKSEVLYMLCPLLPPIPPPPQKFKCLICDRTHYNKNQVCDDCDDWLLEQLHNNTGFLMKVRTLKQLDKV